MTLLHNVAPAHEAIMAPSPVTGCGKQADGVVAARLDQIVTQA